MDNLREKFELEINKADLALVVWIDSREEYAPLNSSDGLQATLINKMYEVYCRAYQQCAKDMEIKEAE